MSSEHTNNSTRPTASQQIIQEVTSWPGVTAEPGRRGELSIKVGHREIGHLHGDRAAHFGFPKDVGAELREQGRVGPHPVNPAFPGWAARRIQDQEDIRDVVALLRLNYDRIATNHGLPDLAGQPQTGRERGTDGA